MTDIALVANEVSVISGQFGEPEIVNVTLTATTTIGQALYQASTGFGIADANDSGKQQFRGIALEGGGAGQVIGMLKRGGIEGFTISGLAADAIVYLSDTAGALADANGSMTVHIGRVYLTATSDGAKVLYVDADWLRTWA